MQKFIDIGGGVGTGVGGVAHVGEKSKKEENQCCLGMKYANEWRPVVRWTPILPLRFARPNLRRPTGLHVYPRSIFEYLGEGEAGSNLGAKNHEGQPLGKRISSKEMGICVVVVVIKEYYVLMEPLLRFLFFFFFQIGERVWGLGEKWGENEEMFFFFLFFWRQKAKAKAPPKKKVLYNPTL